MDLKGRHFLKLLDFTPQEINYLLDLSAELKAKKKQGYADNEIDEEILKYIATNVKSNIRELEGAFNKVIASS